jgi:hypothetical protein
MCPRWFARAKTDFQSHPYEVARILRAKVRALTDPGDFGLLVVGSGAKDLELWEVPRGGGKRVKRLEAVFVEHRRLMRQHFSK